MKEEKNSKLSKLFSVKFWVTIWSMALITFIVFKGKESFILIAELLCFVPLAYLGINVWQKKILSKEGSECGKA